MAEEPIVTDSSLLPLSTLILVQELWGGDHLAYPVAGREWIGCASTEEAVLAEQTMFLSEYLTRVAPAVIASYGLPPDTHLESLDVLIPREDLPRRLQIQTPLALSCVVIPAGKDRWVVVLPLGYTLHVGPDEDLPTVVRSEVLRLVGAQERSPVDYLRLFPARETRLEKISLLVERAERAPSGRAASLRKTIADRQKRRRAVEVIESVTRPLHLGDRPRRVRPMDGRDQELKLLTTLLGGQERLSVVLLGAELTGKSELFRHWLDRERSEGGDPLVYATSGAQLIAGMSGLGQWQERIRRVMDAIEELDAILYFEDLGDLFTERTEGWVDIAGAMKPMLEENRVRVVGELRPDLLEIAETRHIGFFSCLTRLKVEPLSVVETTRALRHRVAYDLDHAPHRPHLDPRAVEPLIDLAERYLPYRSFPGKAFRLYDELRTVYEKERTEQGEPITISREQLFEVFSMSTGVPVFLLRDDRTLRVEDVVNQLGQHVIGQTEAVRRVAETVCVVKAGLQPQGKPLATFLFVGPTGVGKTELARALATFLFGSGDRMVRFDMSEFMDLEAAERLIRGSDRSEGLLTRKVREQPFCVLLLDEIEKASRGVFDLLLQVCGEGRLTDARGKTAYFHNAIIIMTSNLGAAQQRPQAGFLQASTTDEAYFVRQVVGSFRPEFVNRIDRIIAFKPLSPAEANQVTRVALAKVCDRRGLRDNGVQLHVSDRAIERLARGGYSERYGARALRRHLEDLLVTPVARELSALGARGRDVLVRVVAQGEEPIDEAAGERIVSFEVATSEGGLAGVVQQRREGKASLDLRGVLDLSRLRREASKMLHLPRVEQVKEELDYLIVQLNYGDRKRKDRRFSAEVGELQAQHHRLSQVYTQLTDSLTQLEMLEELGLMALFDGDRVGSLLGDAREALSHFKRVLVRALLVQEKRRDAVTFILQDLEVPGACQLWFRRFVTDLERREWVATFQLDGDQDPSAVLWPRSRRWGPPRTADEMRVILAAREPEKTCNLLVTCRGPFAGVLLALEAGVHRWDQPAAGVEKVQLVCSLVSFRTSFADDEWSRGYLTPIPQAEQHYMKIKPIRQFHCPLGRLDLQPSGATLSIPTAGYWPRFEEVALEVLLPFEAEDGPDREALFVAPTDSVPQGSEDS
jgi:ATP-dependent Clp protease ATP-binding subunit ClpC